MKITMGGNQITLISQQIKEGMKAPNFFAVNKDLSKFELYDCDHKVKIISSVPSIDTKVCELQTIQFNQDIANLDGVILITISADLPFAQERFCASKGIENSIVVSDHKDFDFAKKYGFGIEEFRLLSRGVIVINKENEVTYVEYVPEVTNHPNYEKALDEVKKLL